MFQITLQAMVFSDKKAKANELWVEKVEWRSILPWGGQIYKKGHICKVHKECNIHIQVDPAFEQKKYQSTTRKANTNDQQYSSTFSK